MAVAAGAYLVAVAGWQLLLVGAASIAAGVLYTGGPRPYGYEGLGELFVFLFFGVVAVVGSYFVQVEQLEWEAFALSVPVGLLASAILVVNNVRDVDTDRRAGKRTLAVKLGRDGARTLFDVMLVLAFLTPPVIVIAGGLSPWVLLSLLAAAAGGTAATHCRRPNGWTFLERCTRRDRTATRAVLAAPGGRGARVVRRTLARLSIPLREPFATAGGVVAERELVLLRVEDDDGEVGYGEAAPLEPYDGVTIDEVVEALRNGATTGRPRRGRPRRWRCSTSRPAAPDAPIGEPGADVIAVNRTLAGGPPAEVAERAAEGVREGFSCFKLKVGLPDDAERVAAVREAIGPWPAVRIDANGAWSPAGGRGRDRAARGVGHPARRAAVRDARGDGGGSARGGRAARRGRVGEPRPRTCAPPSRPAPAT